jgi:hypothetical protein
MTTTKDQARRQNDTRADSKLQWPEACSICAGTGTAFGKTCVCRTADKLLTQQAKTLAQACYPTGGMLLGDLRRIGEAPGGGVWPAVVPLPSVSPAEQPKESPAASNSLVSARRLLQFIEQAREITTDLSTTGPIPLTLIQIGYIAGKVAHDAAHLARQAQAAQPTSPSDDAVLATWPERIWLQHGFEYTPGFEVATKACAEITWCQDNVNAPDIEYVRADIAAQTLGSVPQTHDARLACIRESGDEQLISHVRNGRTSIKAAVEKVLGSVPQADSGPVVQALEQMIAETDLSYKKGILHEAIRRIRAAAPAQEAEQMASAQAATDEVLSNCPARSAKSASLRTRTASTASSSSASPASSPSRAWRWTRCVSSPRSRSMT